MSTESFSLRIHARPKRRPALSFFGNFGPPGNLGNEGTLQAVLYRVRQVIPDASITCICTNPESVAATYNVAAVSIHDAMFGTGSSRKSLVRLARKIFIGAPCELYRWLKCLKTLWSTDVLIVPGTGLLTDAYGRMNWGPYSVFKWSAVAKLTRCKLLFVSVGAGPLYSRIGRFFVKTALSLADFRSYRDLSSQEYLSSIGFHRKNDRVYPDLVFSLPKTIVRSRHNPNRHRPVVGVGIMHYAGKYSVEKPQATTFKHYVDTLLTFATWLLDHGYDIRLLMGDTGDSTATHEFMCLLNEKLSYDSARILDDPVASVQQLLSQLAATDIVVATRFHNVLLALLLNKPVLSISFHHKCLSLMSQMGLSKYCQDIHELRADRLIEQFCQLEKNAALLRPMIAEKVGEYRETLEEQYRIIFSHLGLSEQYSGSTVLSRVQTASVPVTKAADSWAMLSRPADNE